MKFLLSLSFFGLFTIAASELEDEDGLEVAGAITIAGKEVREKRALGRIYTGSACEYIKLADITSNDGCVDGTKFVLKKEDTVRKQLLIMSGTPILAFVTKGEKFVNCTSYTEVTIQVDCKTVDGLSDVDLSATASPATTTVAATAAEENRDERRIGSFEKTFHAVSGTVYAVGEDKLIIKGFNYDGLGPDAFFFAGTSGDEPSANGDVVLPYPSQPDKDFALWDLSIPRLPRFTGDQQLELQLPAGRKVSELRWLTVWCRLFSVNFGYVSMSP